MNFLPTSKKEVEALGWDSIDIILFTGDAYVDHPSFGVPLLARVLEAKGYRVADAQSGMDAHPEDEFIFPCKEREDGFQVLFTDVF